ncbi:hypothetical protein CROQUDRAFT_136873 [Cronartium quercuum f. sp. fusiforme G11]|uniref:Uncharacterized protein n=1 Tax=Cronartium quercuum f. sp. fusiforme G11 TaxID=708437 RepID=A0A9P6T605_9BASI|nr:hypothetical protein CROQUDRAFT_136873 [Cronartium quercuum f. sp. fusiforme G11]
MLDHEDFSSTSPSEPEAPIFVLHRRLQLRNLPAFNSALSGSLSGVDVFTSNVCQLDKEALQAAAELNDTDIVQVHYPVVLGSATEPKVLLSDIAPVLPPRPSSSKQVPTHRPLTNGHGAPSIGSALRQEALPFKTNVPKMPALGPHGPSVTSLYYSPYSSFAPQYDSTGSLQTCEQTRTSYLSRQQLNHWINRKNRYVEIQPETISLPSSDLATSEELTSGRSRKRQKMDENADLENTSDEATFTSREDHARMFIRRKLATNYLLLRNLQERQYERLRKAQDTHLDPSLSPTSPDPLTASGPSNRSGHPAENLSSEELGDADRLMSSLSELLELRPHALSTCKELSSSTNTHPEPGHRAVQKSIIPSRENIRAAQKSFMQSGSAGDPSPAYSGSLPSGYAVGLKESVLTSQTNTRLLDMLTKPQSNADPSGSNGRISGIVSSLNLNSQQARQPGPSLFSYRDPALLHQHSSQLQNNFRASLPSSNGGSLQSSLMQQPISQSAMLQAQHHLLQSQRLISGSPFRSRPGISSPSPQLANKLPNISSPSMNDHPNHRALASKLPIHSPFNPTTNRIVRLRSDLIVDQLFWLLTRPNRATRSQANA